jgi:hypothetical protein
MSEYTQALSELVELPARLDAELARSEREVAAERKRREEQIESYVAEHETILARLETTLERAGAEGIASPGGVDRGPARLGSDPLEQAAQLVGRLDDALRQALYTRASLETEEAALSEAERKRAAEARRRREREELQRGEAWERAQQGTVGLALALVLAAAAGAAAGAVSAAAVALAALLVGLAAGGLCTAVSSTLPALAVRRATGSMPPLPSVPAREAHLAALAYAGAALSVTGVAALLTALASGVTPLAPAAVILVGVTVTVSVTWLLPRLAR